MTTIRIRACAIWELGPEEVVAVALPPGADKRPRDALLLRSQDGSARAYINRCRHLPIPIDAGSRSYLTQDKRYLLCGTHGALYRRDDGMCIAGPCMHVALESLAVEEQDGELFVLLHGSSDGE